MIFFTALSFQGYYSFFRTFPHTLPSQGFRKKLPILYLFLLLRFFLKVLLQLYYVDLEAKIGWLKIENHQIKFSTEFKQGLKIAYQKYFTDFLVQGGQEIECSYLLARPVGSKSSN